ncbi:MAG: tetratricopeptide repeat protein [Oligoflexales bacterium]
MIYRKHIKYFFGFVIGCNSTNHKETLDIIPRSKTEILSEAHLDWQQFFETPHQNNIKKPATTVQNHNKNLYTQAKNHIHKKNLLKAEHTLQAYLRVHGLEKEPLLDLVMVHIQRHHIKDAFITLQSLREHLSHLEEIPSGFLFRYRYTTAIAYLLNGDHSEGRRILVDLIHKDQSFRPGYQALASSYLAQNQDNIAKFIIQRGIDQSEPSPAFYNLLGALSMNKNEILNAQKWFRKSLKMQPEYTPTLVNLAKLEISRREYVSADHHLQLALKSNPNSIESLVTLGLLKQKTGDHKKSLIAFQKALELYPEHKIARFNMATLLANHLQKPIEALRYFHEVKQLSAPGESLHKVASSYIDDMQ